jgi:hypothetical protein
MDKALHGSDRYMHGLCDLDQTCPGFQAFWEIRHAESETRRVDRKSGMEQRGIGNSQLKRLSDNWTHARR